MKGFCLKVKRRGKTPLSVISGGIKGSIEGSIIGDI
jgi:hypothetical protein